VWKNQRILLDGHARLAICRRHALPFAVTEIDLPDRDAAVTWVLTRQLSRRNLRPIAVAYYRGVLHRLTVAQLGTRVDLDPGQTDRSAAALAREFGVDARTLRRDARLAADLDVVAESLGDGFRRSVLSHRYYHNFSTCAYDVVMGYILTNSTSETKNGSINSYPSTSTA